MTEHCSVSIALDHRQISLQLQISPPYVETLFKKRKATCKHNTVIRNEIIRLSVSIVSVFRRIRSGWSRSVADHTDVCGICLASEWFPGTHSGHWHTTGGQR